MDMIHKFMNILLPISSLILATFFLPLYLLFKLLNTFKRAILAEKLTGKVVLITGASSGIGEYLAYEYAKRGAYLALVARREDRLQMVAGKSRQLGSPDVIVIPGDVSKLEDCKRFVDEAVDHFGTLDHLVNNAGISSIGFFEDHKCISDHASIMDINFWGSVYSTQFAVPHLRKSKGKIIVIASCSAWIALPRLSVYNASKAALISFYETLRAEFGSDIGITIVNPGMVESEITGDGALSKVNMEFVPVESTEGCAKAIVNATSRGEKYLTEPAWMKVLFLLKLVFPEVQEWFNRSVFAARPKTKSSSAATSEKIQDATRKSVTSDLTQSLGYKSD